MEKGQMKASFSSNDKLHSASVKALRVMLLPEDGGHWFAQGLEIDYAACGASEKEATENFVKGLACTVCEHVAMYGNLSKVLVPAPKEAWEEYFNTPAEQIRKQDISFVAKMEILKQAKADEPQQKATWDKFFPFEGIQFLKGLIPTPAAA
jgi:hypothetical protein